MVLNITPIISRVRSLINSYSQSHERDPLALKSKPLGVRKISKFIPKYVIEMKTHIKSKRATSNIQRSWGVLGGT